MQQTLSWIIDFPLFYPPPSWRRQFRLVYWTGCELALKGQLSLLPQQAKVLLRLGKIRDQVSTTIDKTNLTTLASNHLTSLPHLKSSPFIIVSERCYEPFGLCPWKSVRINICLGSLSETMPRQGIFSSAMIVAVAWSVNSSTNNAPQHIAKASVVRSQAPTAAIGSHVIRCMPLLQDRKELPSGATSQR